jgi:hypothetical protein
MAASTASYAVALIIGIIVVLVVGQLLRRLGHDFLREVYGDRTMATALNALLVTLFRSSEPCTGWSCWGWKPRASAGERRLWRTAFVREEQTEGRHGTRNCVRRRPPIARLFFGRR